MQGNRSTRRTLEKCRGKEGRGGNEIGYQAQTGQDTDVETCRLDMSCHVMRCGLVVSLSLSLSVIVIVLALALALTRADKRTDRRALTRCQVSRLVGKKIPKVPKYMVVAPSSPSRAQANKQPPPHIPRYLPTNLPNLAQPDSRTPLPTGNSPTTHTAPYQDHFLSEKKFRRTQPRGCPSLTC